MRKDKPHPAEDMVAELIAGTRRGNPLIFEFLIQRRF